MIPTWKEVLLYRILENQKVIMNALGILAETASIHPLLRDAHDMTVKITNQPLAEKAIHVGAL